YGYVVGPPAAQSTSVCGAVMILPTSRPTASASYVPGSSPVAAPLMSGGSPDDEIPPVTPFTPVPPAQPRAFVPGINPNTGQPIQQNPTPNSPGTNSPPVVQSPGFGPIAPTAPGAGTFGPPAPAPAPNGRGRGGGGPPPI